MQPTPTDQTDVSGHVWRALTLPAGLRLDTFRLENTLRLEPVARPETKVYAPR